MKAAGEPQPEHALVQPVASEEHRASAVASITGEVRSVPSVPDYELLRRIGAGAYGEIWLARSLATGVLRAAKIVWRDKFEDARPFQREFEGIQCFERISRGHPTQLALFHIGRNESAGYFYYVMELADAVESPRAEIRRPKEVRDPKAKGNDSEAYPGGVPLDLASDFDVQPSGSGYIPHTLRADLGCGHLPAVRVLEIGIALSEALANLHGHGLVHRDVKPSNVIFVHGRPKLADIGLVTDAGDQHSIVGTEGYLAPEGPGAPPADLFALGKVLYEAATGIDRRQFPRLPADLRARPDGQLLLELNEIIVKACATRMEERYRCAEDMQADLQLLKIGQSVKHLRRVERRVALLNRAAVVVSLCALIASAVFYETYRQRRIALRSLVRLHVASGAHSLNSGDLFGSLLSFTEALRLDAGDRKNEERHRIRIASVLRECPKLVGMFAHNSAPVNDAAFSPDGRRVITTADDHTAQMWDLATGQWQFSLQHTGPVYSVGFSPDGQRIATTSSDMLVHLWSGQTGEPLHQQPIRHRGWYNGPSPQFSADGTRLLTLPDRYTVQVLSPVTGSPIGNPLRHDHDVSSFMFNLDGQRILTLSSDRLARMWNASTGEAIFTLRHDGVVNCGAFSSDGRTIATGGDDDCVRLWDLASGKEIASPLLHRRPIDSLAFSPDGQRLAAACRDRTVEIWDVMTNRALPRPLLHDRKVLRVDFTPDGRWVIVATEGNRVSLWDADTGELLAPLFVHDTPRRPVIFSPDGHLVLTLRHDLTLEREEIAVVWNLARAEKSLLRIPPAATFRKQILSPDARFEAILSGDTVHTLVRASGNPMTRPLKQTDPFREAYFSRDNSVLLTESSGGRGQLWDLEGGEPLSPQLRVVYDLNAQAPSKRDLAHNLQPAEDLVAMAELLSGNQVDEMSGFRPLDKFALMDRWDTLKRKHHEEFNDSIAEVLAWHDQQAKDCEQDWNWWSALFHLNVLLTARPGDPTLQQRRAYAELALANANRNAYGYFARRYLVVPPRNPQASKAMIDLSGYYNDSRRGVDNSLASLPSGIQKFGGTAFDVRGIVQLADQRPPASIKPLPTEIRGIQIHRTCRRLHFLHATGSQALDGTEVSSYAVHYADGRTQLVRNVYGRDLRCWWTTQRESLTAQRSILVWMGTNPAVESDDAESLRMFKRTWENPWPDMEITSLDFISSGKGARPFLVAVTAE